MTDENCDPFANWDKFENGDILAFPFWSFTTALYEGMGCILRIEFLRAPEKIQTTPEHLQLGLFPDQARALAMALLRMADKAESGPTPGDPKH
jgi:hypothetical protein